MITDTYWCHQCDVPVRLFWEFWHHAEDGHAVTAGRCPGQCQFTGRRGA